MSEKDKEEPCTYNKDIIARLTDVDEVVLKGDPDTPGNSSQAQVGDLLLHLHLLELIIKTIKRVCMKQRKEEKKY